MSIRRRLRSGRSVEIGRIEKEPLMDNFSREKRSYVMSRVPREGTKPEHIVRKFLFSHGFRYRVNVKKLPGSPDIVLSKYKTVIFIHGCFWHGHNFRNTKPKENQEYWDKKRERNMKHDKEITEYFENRGWTVIRIRECELKNINRQIVYEKLKLLQ